MTGHKIKSHSKWRWFKSRWQQNRDCPSTRAAPSLCGANRDSLMARKLLGQPPMALGTVPSSLQSCLNERHSEHFPYLWMRSIWLVLHGQPSTVSKKRCVLGPALQHLSKEVNLLYFFDIAKSYGFGENLY